MEIRFVLLLACFLLLLAVHCSSTADPQVNPTHNAGLDVNNPVTLNPKDNSNKKTTGCVPDLGSIEKGKDQFNKSKEGVNVKNGLDKYTMTAQLESKEDQKTQTDGGSKPKQQGLPVKEEGHKKEKSGEVLKPEEKPKKEKSEGTVVDSTPVKKDNSPAEDCDKSNRCTDEGNNFVACLRVPGDESPDLSLLIQNKGKVSLTVTISAPEYVHLEKTKLQLQQKEDQKVKVSIKHSGSGADNLIILTAGNGRCSLDFRDVIVHDSRKESDTAPKSKYIILLNRTPYVGFVAFALLLIIAMAWVCVSFKRRYFPSTNSKYQKLDMELPVLGAEKPEANVNDGWENSWDDNWDDEAPKTPSMPLTPSLSSKGLASRRFNKEAWKD